MVDLSVRIADLKLKNPIGVSSCPASRDAKRIEYAFKAGAAFVTTKTISTRPASLFVPKPHMAELKGGFINAELWSELSLEEWLDKELPLAKKHALSYEGYLVVSVGHKPEEVKEVVDKVYPYADIIEVALAYLDNLDDMVKAVNIAKKISSKPVIAKPGVLPYGKVVDFVKKMVEAGADVINFSDSYGPVLALDFSTYLPRELLKGRPTLGSKLSIGWLTGPPMKYMVMRMIAEAKSVYRDVQIIGTGGIANGLDAFELLLVGANALEMCTSVILTGYKSIGVVIRQLEELMKRSNISSISEIVGLALSKLPTTDMRDFKPVVYPDKCTGCGLCLESCFYDAISLNGKKVSIDYSKCFGCGLCVTRCRYGALEYPY